MEEEDMDQNNDPAEMSAVGQWMRNWLPPVLIIAAGFLVVLLGNMVGDHNEEVKRNLPPDAHIRLSHCKVVDKNDLVFRQVKFYVNTSCGNFQISDVLYPQIEKDAVYDLDVSYFHGGKTGYITDARVLE
jgi:hypothetical protein